MSLNIMDGRSLAQKIKESLKKRVLSLKEHACFPGLAVILVGENPASHMYVEMKVRQCQEVGIKSFQHILPENVSQQDLSSLINSLNQDHQIHGILLQLPLPEHLNTDTLIDQIDPRKDVDGLTKINIGGLVRQEKSAFIPCTPKGCLKLLETYTGELSGKTAVIIGRSHLVGRPLVQLLLQKNCTVSIVHSKTHTPENLTCQADIVIAAVGQARLVKKSWIKPGAAVVDVGINRSDDIDSGKLVGDVDFDDVASVAGYLTPVPGGVGPMTVACLLENTLESAERWCSWTS